MKHTTLMFKKLFIMATAAAMFAACSQQNANTENTVAEDGVTATETKKNNRFGAEITPDNAITVAELEQTMQDKDSAEVKVVAEIIESCQNKGCWVDVKLADGTPMKVTFKDYGFFVPIEDLSGKKLIMEGTAKREMVSVDDQRHYAEDGGKSKEEIAQITEPKESLVFVANGVILAE